MTILTVPEAHAKTETAAKNSIISEMGVEPFVYYSNHTNAISS